MDLRTEKSGDIVVVTLTGESLDASNVKDFKERVAPILADNRKVIFDLGSIGFVDSSGCGTLLSCLRQLSSNGGDLKLYGVQRPVRTLFELVRMHRIIEIFDTRDAAVDAF